MLFKFQLFLCGLCVENQLNRKEREEVRRKERKGYGENLNGEE
jgi:hypothetical protein